MIYCNRNKHRTFPAIIALFAVAATIWMYGCSDSNDGLNDTENFISHFTACIGNEEANGNAADKSTKTFLNGQPSDPVREIYWIPGDSIAIAAIGSTSAHPFTATCDSLSKESEFEGYIPSAGKYAGFYPCQSSLEFDGNAFHFKLPAVQLYRQGSFANGSFPMVATAHNDLLTFRHLCGVLQLNLTDSFERVMSISFSACDSLGKAMPIAGSATVGMTSENIGTEPSFEWNGTADTLIRMDCGKTGVQLEGEPTTFYIVLPPARYHTFTVSITTHTGKTMTRVGTKPLTVKRGRGAATATLSFMQDDPVINIADASFKRYLVSNFDLNGDNEIQSSEARKITEIKVCTDTIASLSGIENMINLSYLKCSGTVSEGISNGMLTTLDVTAVKGLGTLICSGNKLTRLPLDGLSDLMWLNCNDNSLDSLNLKTQTGLAYLYCLGNNLKELDTSNSSELSICYASDNCLDRIILHHQPETAFSCVNTGDKVWVKMGTDANGEYGYYKPAIYINNTITNKEYK